MSLERVIKILEDFGLKRIDAEVYVFLAKKGPQKGKDMSFALKLTNRQLYRSLKRLQDQNMVISNLERPAQFSALPLEKILDSIIKDKIKKAQAMKETKESFL